MSRPNAADTALWLLRSVQNNPGLTAHALAKLAGISHQSAYGALGTLHWHGYVGIELDPVNQLYKTYFYKG